MNTTATSSQATRRAGGLFVTTRWTQIVIAQDSASPGARRALEELCTIYWRPLYLWLRRQGRSAHDAQDLTQEFFAHLLQRHWLQAADRDKGRFRTFLLVAFKRFLADEWDRARAKKRGGGQAAVPLDTALAEELMPSLETKDSPERVYDRQWGLTLLDRAVASLRREYSDTGRRTEFDLLKDFLTATRGDIPYARVAEDLGSSEAAARVAVHRLRKRFREMLKAEVSQTVADGADVADELRQLLAALS